MEVKNVKRNSERGTVSSGTHQPDLFEGVGGRQAIPAGFPWGGGYFYE